MNINGKVDVTGAIREWLKLGGRSKIRNLVLEARKLGIRDDEWYGEIRGDQSPKEKIKKLEKMIEVKKEELRSSVRWN